jgi:acetyl esterase/lipase
MTKGIGEDWRSLSTEQLDYEYSPSAWSKHTWPEYQVQFDAVSVDERNGLLIERITHNHHTTLLARAEQSKGNLIWIHGGYWQGGSAEASLHHAKSCVEAGINYVAVDYTIAPQATIETMIEQCVQSMQAIATLAPAPLILAGHSAGAHLAAMTASARSTMTHGVLLFSGVYDLRPIVPLAINDPLGLDEAHAWQLSPLRLPFSPNMSSYVLYGEQESAQFALQSEKMANRLWTVAQAVPGADHFDIVLNADFAALATSLLNEREREMKRR